MDDSVRRRVPTRWLAARQTALRPVDCDDVAFTLPAPISAMAYYNVVRLRRNVFADRAP